MARGRPVSTGPQSVRIALAIHPDKESPELVEFWENLVRVQKPSASESKQRLAFQYLLRVAYHYESNGVVLPELGYNQAMRQSAKQIRKAKEEILALLADLRSAVESGATCAPQSLPAGQEDAFSSASVAIAGMLEFDFGDDEDE